MLCSPNSHPYTTTHCVEMVSSRLSPSVHHGVSRSMISCPCSESFVLQTSRKDYNRSWLVSNAIRSDGQQCLRQEACPAKACFVYASQLSIPLWTGIAYHSNCDYTFASAMGLKSSQGINPSHRSPPSLPPMPF